MRLKIRCDGESEKFCKFFWELNKALEKKIYAGKPQVTASFRISLLPIPVVTVAAESLSVVIPLLVAASPLLSRGGGVPLGSHGRPPGGTPIQRRRRPPRLARSAPWRR